MKITLSVLGRDLLALHIGPDDRPAPPDAVDTEFGFSGGAGGNQEIADPPVVARPLETENRCRS